MAGVQDRPMPEMRPQLDPDAEAAFRAKAEAEAAAQQKRNYEMMKGAQRNPDQPRAVFKDNRPAPQPLPQAPQPQKAPPVQALAAAAPTPAAPPPAAAPAAPAAAPAAAAAAVVPPTDKPAESPALGGLMSMPDMTQAPAVQSGGSSTIFRGLGRRTPPMDSMALAGLRRIY